MLNTIRKFGLLDCISTYTRFRLNYQRVNVDVFISVHHKIVKIKPVSFFTTIIL